METVRTFLKWTGRILGGLVVLLAIAGVVVYVLSLRVLRPPSGITGSALAIPADSASVAEGERLARVLGCPGCHGEQVAGRVFAKGTLLGSLPAPALPDQARRSEPADLERAIRRGVGIDGRALLAMPSEMYFDLSDEDLGKILAWVRSLTPEATWLPSRSLRLARLLLVLKQFQPAFAYITPGRQRIEPPQPADTLRLGEYVARTGCPECHGLDLRGVGEFTPSLAIAAGYTPAEWDAFLRTGVAKGGRELPMMSEVARGRLSHLTAEEAEGLRRFLSSLVGR